MSLGEFLYVVEVLTLLCSINSYIKKNKDSLRTILHNIKQSLLGHRKICLIVFITFLLTFIPPILLVVYMKKIILVFINKDKSIIVIAKLYTSMAWIKHLSEWTIRMGMIIATLRIYREWSRDIDIRIKVDKNVEEKDDMIVRNNFSALIRMYHERGQLVSSIQRVFELWFVLQWFAYLVRITMDLLLIVRALITNDLEVEGPEQIWFTLTHLIYDIVTIIVPYVCGTLMNKYNERFLSEMGKKQEEIFSKSKNLSVWLMQRFTLIPEQKSYQFTPSLFYIAIPLRSTVFSISIIVSLFTCILSLLISLARSVN